MNDEFGLPIGSEVGVDDAFLVFSHQRLSFVGIVFSVQDEFCVDDIAREWKHVERSMNQMIPITSDVQAANFSVATGLVFNWKEKFRKCLKTIKAVKCVDMQKSAWCGQAKLVFEAFIGWLAVGMISSRLQPNS